MNTYQCGDKTFFDFVQLSEGQDGVPHLPVPEPALEYFTDLVPDGFRILTVKGADSCFTGICQTQQSQLLVTGRGPSVTEDGFVNRDVRIFRLGFGVKEVDQRIPVMGPDGVTDQCTQPVGTGKTQPLYDVSQDHPGTLGGRKVKVEFIAPAVVLDEITRFFKFADIVKKRGKTYNLI